MVFLSICVCSIRPGNIAGLMDNLQQTAADPGGFELLVCVNAGDRAVIDAIEAQRGKVGFPVRVAEEPRREGYYSLHHGYEALRAMAAPSAYFIWQISDEIRIDTQGWDTRLKAYKGLFGDDLFRLRLSLNKWRHYYYLYECFPYPDNYTVTSRAWYEAAGGSGEVWGPDSWHQGIDYFLGMLKNPFAPYGKGVFRSIPVHDVALANEEAGQGLTHQQSGDRQLRIKRLYKKLCGLRAQENFLRLAMQVNARIWMHGYGKEHPGARLSLREDARRRTVEVAAENGAALYTQSYSIVPFLLRRLWQKARRTIPNLGLVDYLLHRLRRG